MAGSDTDNDTNFSTLAQKAPRDGESESTDLAAPQQVDSMEVHRKNWHCLNLFRPPYVYRDVAFACPLWSVRFVEGPTPTRTSGYFQNSVRR